MDTENPNPELNENTLNGAENSAPAENVSAPKRRGRPPKNSVATGTGASSDAAPKRRGRPRKNAEDDATNAVAPAENFSTESAPAATVSAEPTPEAPRANVPETPAPAKPVFSFDPNEPTPPPAPDPVFPDPEFFAPRESAPAQTSEPAPSNSAPANSVESGENRAFQPRPWERKDRPWKQKPWERKPRERDGADGNLGGNAPASDANDSANAPRPWEKKDRAPFPPKPPKFGGGKFNQQGKFEKFRNDKNPPARRSWGELANTDSAEEASLSLGTEYDYNLLENETYLDELSRLARHIAKRAETAPVAAPAEISPTENSAELLPDTPEAPINFNEIYESSMTNLIATARAFDIPVFRNPVRRPLVKKILRAAFAARRPITIHGTLEPLADGNGLLLYGCDSYRVKELSAFVPASIIKKYGLQRGHDMDAIAYPPMKGETAPIVVHVESIMGADPADVKDLTPFTELTPYYPTERIMLETDDSAEWNNLSMRCVDLLCPIGLGQRGLIVAPPRTGKTVLLQAIANSIAKNKPNAHLIVLLVDERPEEVTDFKRKTRSGEVISSTFDETAENHVHVAEMVIERARRMVELGKDVIILLDSITRLARAYNTLMPNGGKILSGGVEAGALSKPKRFFGSARNIEGGGSLTILGTALIDTGSKMDEVIFEEFKGTGNMELDLDRDLANKRIYPAINFERSGTRKEELLYHPQEMQCVYSMRRAMKGVPSIEAMEMLISRMKKTKTNAEFLITLAGR